ncbi:MAG: histidine kinase [Burkholderiales bacterium]|nr:histidine kinase [Burkholderiales bacterium]
MPPPIMRSIIRQSTPQAALPDFRNLGVVLRILVAVNAGAALCAFARQSSPAALFADWTLATTMVEPPLFATLAVLWVVSPRLARQPFATGVGIVALVAMIASLAFYPLFRQMVPGAPTHPLRWLVWSLVAVAALAYWFHLRARALSPAITEARLQALQARIRPHFLFNSINAVLSLVRAEPARAEHALQDMADLFRVLMRDNRNLAPLADEVELCRQYLELEQLRLGDRLRVEWNLKSMPGDAQVPPLVLQPLLENAVYHGIEPSSAPGVVSVNIFEARGEVHAILRNPYRAEGGRHHSGNKMALANVRERLALHFDAEANLESRVTKDGYEVHIRLPYRKADGNATPKGPPRERPAGGNHGGKGGSRRAALALVATGPEGPRAARQLLLARAVLEGVHG